MRPDTVAEAVGAHLGITKAELLDPSAPDMAVRQALGETQVIASTKSALGDAGWARICCHEFSRFQPEKEREFRHQVCARPCR